MPTSGLQTLQVKVCSSTLRSRRRLQGGQTSSWLESSSAEHVSAAWSSQLTVDFGPRQETTDGVAYDTMVYSIPEVERITRVACQIALAADPPLPVHSIDKANVLASSRLWRKCVTELMAKEYPQLKLDHQLVDSAAMVIVSNPRKLNGVIVTENLFGDM
jgi:isocitrate/isopropylmalate dehydrogenase